MIFNEEEEDNNNAEGDNKNPDATAAAATAASNSSSSSANNKSFERKNSFLGKLFSGRSKSSKLIWFGLVLLQVHVR